MAPAPFLFLQGKHAAWIEDLRTRLVDCGLASASWEALRVRPQRDGDLGVRLEHAFETLCVTPDGPGPVLILGSDSPSLPPAYVRNGMERLGLQAHSSRGTGFTGRAEDSACNGRHPHMYVTDQHRDSAVVIRPDAPSADAPPTDTQRLAIPTTSNTASGGNSSVCGGAGSTASGDSSSVSCGRYTTAVAQDSWAAGGYHWEAP